MRYGILPLLILLLMSMNVCAADFAPTLLKIDADPVVQYDFDGRPLDLPVMVNGTTAGLIFSVFTKDKADDIVTVQNGYLGWHWVNKVDTCIYYAPLKHVFPGANSITWDGRNQDGELVEQDIYTYYIWAFDSQGVKQQMGKHLYSGWGFDYRTGIQEVDESGLPLANPIWYNRGFKQEATALKWIIGSDPLDETLSITSTFTTSDGWEFRGEPLIDPYDSEMWYTSVGNAEAKLSSIQKFRFIPGGQAELQTDWGESDGFATIFSTCGGGSPGVATDGMYLYTGDENHVATLDPDADFYIYDIDGYMITEVDLSPWWSNPDDLEAGGQMNGGPNNFFARDGNIYLNCHCNCLNQMVNPARFMETEEYDDFFVWSNGNGDYTLDHNFEETAQLKWICNDYNVGPYKYSISADANGFTAANAYDVGAVSFGLLAPDGTGLGYYAFAGETAGWKKGTIFLDGDTPYDGIYCDNQQTQRPIYHVQNPNDYDGIYFIGHDSISGIISYSGNTEPYLTLKRPNGGERIQRNSDYTVQWHSHDIYQITIEYSLDGGGSWTTIAGNVAADLKQYVWRVPVAPSDNCLLRLTDANRPNVRDVSERPFSIVRSPDTDEYYLSAITNTGNSATVLIDADNPPRIDGNPIDPDDNIGVFTPRGLCAGAVTWDGINTVITVWGDDSMLDGTRGFLPGEEMTFKIWHAAEDREYIVYPAYSTGGNSYVSDGIHVLSSLENRAVHREIQLSGGWHYLSIPLRLADFAVSSVLSGIADHVVIMKNGAGDVYWPEYGVNDIGHFGIADGYKIYISASCTLALDGYEMFSPDVMIALREGWNLIGYPGRDGLSAEDAFAAIPGTIVVKDGQGRVYWPEYEINDIGSLSSGHAYWVYVKEATEFHYPAITSKTVASNSEPLAPAHFGEVRMTGDNATLLIPGGCVRAGNHRPGTGDEIGVFSSDGHCVGAARIGQSGSIALALRGNDDITEDVDGLIAGESFRLVYWNAASQTECDITAVYASPAFYEPNALLTVSELTMSHDVSSGGEKPGAFTLSQNSPNPFNPTTSIPFTLPKEGHVTMTVYDITGRRVATLADGAFAAGSHEVTWDASQMASGVYICRLEAAGKIRTVKMTLAK